MTDHLKPISAPSDAEIRGVLEALQAELWDCFAKTLARIDEISRCLEAGQNE